MRWWAAFTACLALSSWASAADPFGTFSFESIRAADVPAPESGAALAWGAAPRRAAEPGFCQKSWEEAPGTTDYTVFDRSEGRPAGRSDRSARWSLLENPDHQGRSFCDKAAFLRPCFEKALRSGSEAAEFRAWARSRTLDPARVLMALAAQETDFGSTPDHCRRGRCNGVGLMQVVTALDPDGRRLDGDDPRWDGITFNILTNIRYAVRIALDKTPGSRSIASFARRYNASSTAAEYARRVQSYYARLGACR